MIDAVTSKVKVVFTADTSDMKNKLKDLTGEERKLAEAQLKAAEERNKAIESNIKAVGRLTAAITIGIGAGIAVWDRMKEQAEKARLSTAALGVDLELLGKAALGTRDRMALLSDAAKMNNGVFKLTSEQMMVVERAMMTLARKGHDYEDVNRKVLQAVTELKDDGLKELGIVIDKTGLSMESAADRYELLKRILGELTVQAKAFGDTNLTMAEQVREAQARMKDGWDDLKGLFLDGAMIGDPAMRAHFLRMQAEASKKGVSTDEYLGYEEALQKAIGINKASAAQAAQYASQFPKFGHEIEMPEMNIGAMRADAAKKYKEAWDQAWKDIVAGAVTSSAPADYEMAPDNESYWASVNTDAALRRLKARRERERKAESPASMMYGEDPAGYEGFQAKQDEAANLKLEKMFGPISEINLYREAFEGLTKSLGAGFGAWIDGSKSVGKAFKEMLRESLKATAMEMFSQAVLHGAYALGSLAFGRFEKAAFHAKAAASHAAGAVLIGGMAKAMYGGGGSSPSTGASAPGGGVPAYSGGSQDRGQAQTTVIAYGDSFSNDSARQRSLRAQRVVEDAQRARGYGGASYA